MATVALIPGSGFVEETLTGAQLVPGAGFVNEQVGVTSITGTLSATESGDDTASLSGTVKVSGTLAANESGDDTASFSGELLVMGMFSAAETGEDTASISGNVSISGLLSALEVGDDLAAFSGYLATSGITGYLSATETGSDTAIFTSGAMTMRQLINYMSAQIAALQVRVEELETQVPAAVLTAAMADPIHANVKEVNSLTVDGSGTSSDPWGPV